MARSTREGDRGAGVLRGSLGTPVVQFTLAGVAAVILVGIVAFLLLVRAGREEAIGDAKQITSFAGRGIIEPVVSDALVAGDADARRLVDDVVRQRILGKNGVVRVKIWNADSQIIYSDEPRLVGETFSLDEEEREILFEGGTAAETTDLSGPENRFEPKGSDLTEVYLPIRAPSGEPLLFETYVESSFVSDAGQRIWSSLAPVLIGALLVLTALQLPLAVSLARRLKRGQEERETLLERAIDASEMERRRIAQDLHDGVVQDLAGVSYSVAAVANRLDPVEEPEGRTLRDAASQLRQSLRDLRGLLVEIYPPDLHRSGLGPALSDIVGGLNSRGLQASLDGPDTMSLPGHVQTLLFRVAQEALRNVVAHSGAGQVAVRFGEELGRAWLEVEDDGRGFSTGLDRGSGGHFGLRMLSDLAADAGGTFAVHSVPGQGTRARVEVPLT